MMSMGSLTFDAAVAKYSEAADAAEGGDMGWIARYQLPAEMEQAVFNTPVGSVSPTVTTSQGHWVFKIVAEETRTPDADDQANLKRLRLRESGGVYSAGRRFHKGRDI